MSTIRFLMSAETRMVIVVSPAACCGGLPILLRMARDYFTESVCSGAFPIHALAPGRLPRRMFGLHWCSLRRRICLPSGVRWRARRDDTYLQRRCQRTLILTVSGPDPTLRQEREPAAIGCTPSVRLSESDLDAACTCRAGLRSIWLVRRRRTPGQE